MNELFIWKDPQGSLTYRLIPKSQEYSFLQHWEGDPLVRLYNRSSGTGCWYANWISDEPEIILPIGPHALYTLRDDYLLPEIKAIALLAGYNT